MRLISLTIFALIAFAANSVLTRSALALDQIGPGAFMAVRLVSGAVMLSVLVVLRGGVRDMLQHGSVVSAASLLLYAGAFSFAYVTLDAGLGALILFGGVQITMFTGAIIKGERPAVARWIGSLLGMIGLGVLFAPGASSPDIWGAVLMVFSAIGWGVYSLRGRSVSAPLQATASNFILAALAGIVLWLVFPSIFLVTLIFLVIFPSPVLCVCVIKSYLYYNGNILGCQARISKLAHEFLTSFWGGIWRNETPPQSTGGGVSCNIF